MPISKFGVLSGWSRRPQPVPQPASLSRDAELLLEFATICSGSTSPGSLFLQQAAVARKLVPFEEALLLSVKPSEPPRVVKATCAEHETVQWPLGDCRSELGRGNPVVVDDLSTLRGWRLEEDLRNPVSSALYVPLRLQGRLFVAVAVHSTPGFFNAYHAAVAKQCIPQACQALILSQAAELKIEREQLGRRLELAERRTRQLESAMLSMGQGIAVVAGDGRLVQASESLHEMTQDWPSIDAWWRQVQRASSGSADFSKGPAIFRMEGPDGSTVCFSLSLVHSPLQVGLMNRNGDRTVLVKRTADSNPHTAFVHARSG